MGVGGEARGEEKEWRRSPKRPARERGLSKAQSLLPPPPPLPFGVELREERFSFLKIACSGPQGGALSLVLPPYVATQDIWNSHFFSNFQR